MAKDRTKQVHARLEPRDAALLDELTAFMEKKLGTKLSIPQLIVMGFLALAREQKVPGYEREK